MRPAFVLALLLSLSAVALAANSVIYTVDFYDTPSCTGNFTQFNYTDESCSTFGTNQSVAWELYNATTVSFLTWPVAQCQGNVTSYYHIQNSVCFQTNTSNSLKATWDELVDISVYTYASNDTQCAAQATVSSILGFYCYSYTNSSTAVYTYNSTTGLACSWNESGCPVGGECVTISNGDCMSSPSGNVRFEWGAQPIQINFYEFNNTNCAGDNATTVFSDDRCYLSALGNGSRVDVFSAATAVYYTWPGTCAGTVSLTLNLTNNQCIVTPYNTSVLAVWSNSSFVSTTTSQSSSTTASTSSSTGTTGVQPPDLFYYVFSTQNCTGTPSTSSYYNNACFGTIGNTSELASIESNSSAKICNYTGSTCGGTPTCFSLPNSVCYNSTAASSSYMLVWNYISLTTSTSSSPSSSSTTSTPGSTSTSTPSSSTTSPVVTTTTTSASSNSTTTSSAGPRAGVRSAALVLCAALSFIFA